MEVLCCSERAAATEKALVAMVVEAALLAAKSIAWLLMGISSLPNASYSFLEGKELVKELRQRHKSEAGPENKDRSDSEEDDEEEDDAGEDPEDEGDDDDASGDEGNEEEEDEDPAVNGGAGSGDEDDEDEEDEDEEEGEEGEDEDEEEEEDEDEEALQPPTKKRK